MKRFALMLALYAGAFGPSFGILAASPPPHDPQAAFEYACKTLAYDCTDVTPPRVEWVDLYHTYGAHGMFTGADVVYLDIGVMRFADPVYIQSVLAHETVHYIDFVQGRLTGDQADNTGACLSEFNAWRVGNAYVITHGRPDLADFTWQERYRCFQ